VKPVLNQQTFLWIIGVIQPASAREVEAYVCLGFDEVSQSPDAGILQNFCMEQVKMGRLLRVARDPDLFSLTAQGNDVLSKRHRHTRDKVRLYLLKDARRNRVSVSREETATGLGGAAPSADERLDIKGTEANKLGPVVPRGQSYWPRFSRQLLDETGLSQSSRDTNSLPFLSFASEQQLALAQKIPLGQLTLDFRSLGLLLGISPRLVVQISRNPDRHYRTFPLKKKGGGERTIDSPRTFLKVLQQFLVDYYLSGLPVHDCVESYRQGRSIQSNAGRHSGKAYVASLDIENFFGSIRREEILGLLRRCGYDEVSAEIVSRLCTKDGVLPQGAPTSPSLSNAYLIDFDIALAEQCQARALSYSRYADDITISGDDRAAIEEMKALSVDMLRGEFALHLNQEKIRIASRHGQQRVTGAVVNEGVRPPRKLRRQIRAAFYNAKCSESVTAETFSRLGGYLSYLLSFETLRGTEELRRYSALLNQVRQKLP